MNIYFLSYNSKKYLFIIHLILLIVKSPFINHSYNL